MTDDRDGGGDIALHWKTAPYLAVVILAVAAGSLFPLVPQGWPPRIDDPLPPKATWARYARGAKLRQTSAGESDFLWTLANVPYRAGNLDVRYWTMRLSRMARHYFGRSRAGVGSSLGSGGTGRSAKVGRYGLSGKYCRHLRGSGCDWRSSRHRSFFNTSFLVRSVGR